MATQPSESASYIRLGQAGARSPVVIAVPHAGRHYPPDLLAAARLPRHALETIEDRHADLLVADAVSAGAVAIVARIARAYVDLNRDEREIEPALLGAAPTIPLMTSAKVSGGLGVIPSRIAAGGAVWKRPLGTAAVEARLAEVHRPYHAAVAAALDAACRTHGFAVLLDCHSMPSLGAAGPRIVVGDRHGRSAEPRFAAAAIQTARAAGIASARNIPYAGGHTLDRHGQPAAGRHAVQVEMDRGLYLDDALRQPGAGLPRARRLIAAMTAALEDEGRRYPIAAE